MRDRASGRGPVPHEAGGLRLGVILRAVLRESRAARGRLLLLTGCLAIGVAAVVGVSSLVGAIEAGLRGESRELLAADLRVSARRPLPPELDAFFADVPHARAGVLELAAMASAPPREPGSDAGERAAADSVLVELKVVDGAYPFYGELELAPAGVELAELGAEAVLAGPELLAALGLRVGDEVRIGGAGYRVAAELLSEPDRLEFAMTMGPRVLMTAEGAARTELLAGKTRVRHRALYRLDGDLAPETLEQVAADLREFLGDPAFLDVRTHGEAQPGVARSLGRVEDYLGLVALLSLLLGGIGVSQIVRAWLAGRAAAVAVMRSLGFRAREIAGLYLGHVVLLALAGSLAGAALGALLPWAVRSQAPELFRGDGAHLWQPFAVLRGIALGLFVALVFTLPPLTAVWRVSPAAVLRAEAAPLAVPRAVRLGAPAALLAGVALSAWLQAGEWLPALAFTGGLAALGAALYCGARAVTWLASRVPRGRLGPYLEHGLAALARPGAGATGAVVALGLGVMVVVSMLLVERRLSHALRESLPADAPSVFLVDVQPDQWPNVRAAMEEHGARSIDSVPVVMARLRAIDGRPVAEIAAELERRREEGEDDGGREGWVLTREQRLTWLEELPESNELVAARDPERLWSDPAADEISLEEEFARDLGVDVGARLRFDVQGVPVELTVTSLRAVEWQSFAINFFVVVEPGVLEEAPHSRIAAARVDPPRAEYALQNDIAAEHPNVTLLRVRPILEKIAGVLERLAFGVRALGSFTIVTGLVILAGAVATTALRRTREAALLKALGVTRAGVSRLFAVEYALGGLVAGALGSAGAVLLAHAFLEELVELDTDPALLAIPIAALATALLATASGLAASTRALRARPLETLR